MKSRPVKRNIWRSERLQFRPVEDTDDAFLQSLNEDTSDHFQQTSLKVPIPPGTANTTAVRERMQNMLLGCVICLAPAQGGAAVASSTDVSLATPAPSQTPHKPALIPIGLISLTGPDSPAHAHHRDTTLGISLGDAYQGHGYGTEAILWALEFAFRHANLHRVAIGAHGWNEGAWKLYERLGFVMEGRKREAAWYDGGWTDLVLLGMLRKEWEGRYGKGRAAEQ